MYAFSGVEVQVWDTLQLFHFFFILSPSQVSSGVKHATPFLPKRNNDIAPRLRTNGENSDDSWYSVVSPGLSVGRVRVASVLVEVNTAEEPIPSTRTNTPSPLAFAVIYERATF